MFRRPSDKGGHHGHLVVCNCLDAQLNAASNTISSLPRLSFLAAEQSSFFHCLYFYLQPLILLASWLLMLLLPFCCPTKRGSPCSVFCPSNAENGQEFHSAGAIHVSVSFQNVLTTILASRCSLSSPPVLEIIISTLITVSEQINGVWWSGYELWPPACELSISCLQLVVLATTSSTLVVL